MKHYFLQMKPSQYLQFSLLVLFIFFSSTVQGIHLERSFKSMRNSNGVIGDVILCRQGHCTGKGRKLFTATTTSTPSTTSSKREEINGGKQEKLHVHDQYVDIVEMDYSPARRKPPIHN